MNDSVTMQRFDLSRYCAAVVGCGGLGTNVAVHLAGMGIGKLILIDFDTVERSNLNRQFLYTPDDVGSIKCGLLASRLRAYAPDCTIECRNQEITCTDDLSFAADADIFIAASDSNAPRRVLNEYCMQNKKPLVNGGVNGFYGTAYLYVPGRSASLAAAGLLNAENRQPISISSTVGVIGALQAQLAAKCLSGDTQQAGKLYIFDNEEIRSMLIKYKE